MATAPNSKWKPSPPPNLPPNCPSPRPKRRPKLPARSDVLWYWFFTGPALLLAFFSLRGERRRAAYIADRLSITPGRLPPASVIVPVKGLDEGLRENLAALAALDYPDYELVVAADSAEDIPPSVLPRRAKVVLAHGKDTNTS